MKQFRDESREMLLELRGKLGTVVPPSRTNIDKSDPKSDLVPRAWIDDKIEPATVDGNQLSTAAKKIAAASILARSWNVGNRHQLSLHIAGTVAHAGWDVDSAKQFLKAVCAAANDDEQTARLKNVDETFKKLNRGEKVTGFPSLAKALDGKVAGKVAEWLGLPSKSENTDAKEEASREPRPWEPISLATLLTSPPPETDWLFPNIIARGTVSGIGGYGGVGKSYFLLQLAISCAMGRTLFPSLPTTAPIRAMVILAEDSRNITLSRCWHILRHCNVTAEELELLEKNLRLHAGEAEPLVTRTDDGIDITDRYRWMQQDMGLFEPDLLILDPKSRFADIDENDNTAATQFVKCIEDLARPHNTTVLISHHFAKGKGQEFSAASSRGASAFVDACRSFFGIRMPYDKDMKTLGLSGEPTGYAVLMTLKQNYAAHFPQPIVMRRGDGGVLTEIRPTADRQEGIQRRLVEFVAEKHGVKRRALEKPERDSDKELFCELSGENDWTKAEIKAAIADAIDAGGLALEKRDTGGRSATFVVTSSTSDRI